jgi:cytochrome P450
MDQLFPAASFLDNLAFNILYILPYYLQGIFTKNKRWVSIWTAIHPDYAAVKFVQHLRSKYRTRYLYIYMLRNKSLLVLDHQGIRRVLDNSPAIYAEADLKRRGMSHFQPDAVTISHGTEWKDRRRFNEAVLESSQHIHSCADQFLSVIRREIESMTKQCGPRLGWHDFDRLFKTVTLQIIFGDHAKSDTGLTSRLEVMMRESNRVFLLGKSRVFDSFYARIRAALENPEKESLSFQCRHAPSTPATKIEHQIPHWMFAMMETLATNTIRTLALIVAHPQAESRVRSELRDQAVLSPAAVDSLHYLEGCLQEGMRLWPTTPLLVRETLDEDVLGSGTIPAKTQILIMNNFNHRDWETVPFADKFNPEFWLNRAADYRFNHLSNGVQICAGKHLALFIGKAVLATVLLTGRYRLKRPELNPRRPMPYAYNEFQIEFENITGRCL